MWICCGSLDGLPPVSGSFFVVEFQKKAAKKSRRSLNLPLFCVSRGVAAAGVRVCGRLQGNDVPCSV